MPIPLGVLAVAGAGGGGLANDYVRLETTILGTAAASVTFSNLNNYSQYRHLQIRYVAKNTGFSADFGLRLNGVTGSTYASHFLFSDGGSVTSGSVTSVDRIRMPQGLVSSSATNVFAAGVIDFLDFNSSSKTKTVRMMYGYLSTFGRLYFRSGFDSNSTAALTSITLLADANNIEVGSRFSLYGIK